MTLVLLLLSLVVLLSFTYRFSQRIRLSGATRQIVINTHAWSIEAIQSLIALSAVDNAVFFLRATVTARYTWSQDDSGQILISYKAVIVVCIAMAANVFAIYAVDLIEAWITGGKLGHPYHWRSFVLTRSILSPSKKPSKILKGRRRGPQLCITIPPKIEEGIEGLSNARPRAPHALSFVQVEDIAANTQVRRTRALSVCNDSKTEQSSEKTSNEKIFGDAAYLDLAMSERQWHLQIYDTFLKMAAAALQKQADTVAESSAARGGDRTSQISKEAFVGLLDLFRSLEAVGSVKE